MRLCIVYNQEELQHRSASTTIHAHMDLTLDTKPELHDDGAIIAYQPPVEQ